MRWKILIMLSLSEDVPSVIRFHCGRTAFSHSHFAQPPRVLKIPMIRLICGLIPLDHSATAPSELHPNAGFRPFVHSHFPPRPTIWRPPTNELNCDRTEPHHALAPATIQPKTGLKTDRKSTRLNSSHTYK